MLNPPGQLLDRGSSFHTDTLSIKHSWGPRQGSPACSSHPCEDRCDIFSHWGPLHCHNFSKVRWGCLTHALPQTCMWPILWWCPMQSFATGTITPNHCLSRADLEGKGTLHTFILFLHPSSQCCLPHPSASVFTCWQFTYGSLSCCLEIPWEFWLQSYFGNALCLPISISFHLLHITFFMSGLHQDLSIRQLSKTIVPAYLPAHQHVLSLQFEEFVLTDKLSSPGFIHPWGHSLMRSHSLVQVILNFDIFILLLTSLRILKSNTES